MKMQHRSVPQLVQLPEKWGHVSERDPVQPVDQLLAFLAVESDDQELDISDIFLSPGTLAALRQAVKYFLGLKGLPSAAVEVMRFPIVQPTLPQNFALLRPPDDRLVARRARKGGAL